MDFLNGPKFFCLLFLPPTPSAALSHGGNAVAVWTQRHNISWMDVISKNIHNGLFECISKRQDQSVQSTQL
jgi:hypothetical protein